MTYFENPPQQSTPDHATKMREHFLFSELPAQFNTQTASLRAVGLLESILKENTPAVDELVIELQEGITGMDGRAYPLPSIEEITKHFSQEKYAEKISQGFTKLLIVPFAYPLATIRARYEQALIKHHKEGKLLDRDEKPLGLDTKRPLYFLEELNKSDETGDLIYYPTQLDTENHGGYTKQELLTAATADAQLKSPFPGFHILLIKPDLTIPREGSGTTTKGRKDLEAGKSPKEYLNTIQTHPEHKYEQGTTLEDFITLALTHLHETDRVLDDFTNNMDSFGYTIANLYKSSNLVPYSSWSRVNHWARVHGDGPWCRYERFGARSAVG